MKKKIIYVVGGSGLIGSEVVSQIDKNIFKVVVLDTKQNLKLNSKIIFQKFDCTKLQLIKKKIVKFIKKFGKPDVFINCSYPKTKEWENLEFKKENIKILRENVDYHLNSYTILTQVICNNIKRTGGSIINVSSIYGEVAQDETIYKGTKIKANFAYSLIKSGIIGITKSFASHYGKYNIRVNSVSPGGIKDKKNKKQNSKFIKNYSYKVPLKRMANPEEVAAPILFLASDKSSYITGINLMVDGGWTCT